MDQIYLIIIIDFTISILHFLSILLIPDLLYDACFTKSLNENDYKDKDKNLIMGYYNTNLITRILFLWIPKLICISMDDGLTDSNVPLTHPNDFSGRKNYEKAQFIENAIFNNK